MDLLNNIIWYFDEPKNAKISTNYKLITKEQLNTIVFDDSVKDNVKICFPLNEHFTFSETREIQRPITVKKMLEFIRNFYDEPLDINDIDKAFEDNEDWKDEIIDKYDGDINQIIKYDVFVDINCSPDFCGLEFNEETGEYFVIIGPV